MNVKCAEDWVTARDISSEPVQRFTSTDPPLYTRAVEFIINSADFCTLRSNICFPCILGRKLILCHKVLETSEPFCGFQRGDIFIKNKKEGNDQELIQSSTPPDPEYQCESDNATIRHHKREPRGRLQCEYGVSSYISG